MEAVRLTLRHSPNIRLEEATVDFQEGVVQEQQGAFDISLTGDLGLQYSQEALTNTVRASEQEKRDTLQTELDNFTAQADATEASLRDIEALQADPAGFEVADVGIQAQVNLINAFIDRADSEARRTELTGLRDERIEQERQRLATLLPEQRANEAETRLDLEKLGAVPVGEEDSVSSVDLKLGIPLRSGLTFTPFFDFGFTGTNFLDKKRDTELGGKGVEDAYDSNIGFILEVPLGQGRGSRSAAAGEKAAGIDYEASLSTLRHSVSRSVLATAQIYWSLVGAQERIGIFEQSVELQQSLVEIVQALIDAGEVARSELARVRARETDARARLDAARRDFHSARLALADAVGLEVEAADRAPSAGGAFPETLDLGALDKVPESRWLETALDRRQDLDALHHLRESGRVLAQAARVNLRRQLDLEVEGSYGAIAEGSDSGRALDETLTGEWAGPSGRLGLTVDWPFANRAARGKLQQSEASYRLRAIGARDLERTIRSSVLLTLEELRFTAEELRRSDEAAEQYRLLIDAEVEKLRLGSSTLISTILTEQRLTDSLLGQSAARQRFWQLLARLRFETATLVLHPEGDDRNAGRGGGHRVRESALLALPSPDEARPVAAAGGVL